MTSTAAKPFVPGATRVASVISVMIVEANPGIRASLQDLVSRAQELDCLAASGSLSETLDQLRRLSPDVLLLDARLLTSDGDKSIAKIKAASPRMAILILTTFDLGMMMLSLIREGAQGDLPKTTPAAELIQAVKWVKSGGSLMSVSLARRVLSHFPANPKVADTPLALTPQEHAVVLALARGETYRSVAGQRGLGVPTVLEMLRDICGKIQVEARVT